MANERLTEKQEKFAQLVAKGVRYADAYRQSYDVRSGTTDNTIYNSAWGVMRNPKVAQRVKELQKECNNLQLRTREQSLKRLIDISEECYKAAKSEKKWTAKNSCFTTALKAESQIAKMCGFDAAEKVDATISITLSSELDEYGS